MASTDLTLVERDRNRERERQVRSYHRAYQGELMLYSFGNDLRPWRPIAARQIYWTVGLLATAFVFARVAGLVLPLWSMGWFVFYFLIPGGLGWLFTRALIEGRYLHVVIASWMRHALCGQHLMGGYQRVSRHGPMKKKKVTIQVAYLPRSPLPVLYKVAAVLIAVILAAVGTSVSRHPAPRIVPASHLSPGVPTIIGSPASTIVTRRVRYPHHHVRRARTFRRAAARHDPARRAAALRHRNPSMTTPRPVTPRTRTTSVVRYVAPAPISVPTTSRVVSASTPTHRSGSSTPRPDPAPVRAPAPKPRPDKVH